MTYLMISESWNETEEWPAKTSVLFNPIGDTYQESGVKFNLAANERFMIGDHEVMYEIKPRWSLIE